MLWSLTYCIVIIRIHIDRTVSCSCIAVAMNFVDVCADSVEGWGMGDIPLLLVFALLSVSSTVFLRELLFLRLWSKTKPVSNKLNQC